MTGGLCIGNEWSGDPARGRRAWRDTMVVVCGPAVAALEGAFARMWARAGPALPVDEAAGTNEECGPSGGRGGGSPPGQSSIYRALQMLAAAVTAPPSVTYAYLIPPPPPYASLLYAPRAAAGSRRP